MPTFKCSAVDLMDLATPQKAQNGSTLMPETAMPRRAWRLDRTGSSPDEVHPETEAESRGGDTAIVSFPSALESRHGATGPIPRSIRAVWNWLKGPLVRMRRNRIAFEEVIHQFAALIDRADDPADVEAELLRLVRRMEPSTRIELVAEPDVHDEAANPAIATGTDTADESRHAIVEIPLRCGAAIRGRLRFRPRAGSPLSFSRDDIRRLTTLGTMAACAMEGLGLYTEWPQENRSHCERTTSISADRADAASFRHSILFQDATFLNAVLPFALSQARRHREPLSLVCVAIDRLSAIKQLLGMAESDRLVQHVAGTVGSLIRASDIVARLDDDRVVAVLPRAPRGGAMHVAENICRSVQANGPVDCQTPSVTVSIGVATFPSCADNVYSLFDAADEALAWAQKNGRSQAVLAHPRPMAGASQANGASSAV